MHQKINKPNNRWSGRATNLLAQIQCLQPFGPLSPQQVCPLPLEQVNPVIRIAHRYEGLLQVPERIIFDYELVLFISGKGIFTFGSEQKTFAAHDLFHIPPFVPHAIAADGVCDHLAVHFDWAPGVPGTGHLSQRRPYEVRLPGGLGLPRQIGLLAGDSLEEELQQLVVAWQRGDPLGGLEATGHLLRVLTTMLRRTAVTTKDQSARDRLRLERALALLRDPSVSSCSPLTLARAAGLSVSHFNRLFREWTGFSPMDYQRRQRVARARSLLGDTQLTIKEIAAACGFDDPYHFSRVFRQVDGLSPSQYREAALASRPR